jgi:hypothetical protein
MYQRERGSTQGTAGRSGGANKLSSGGPDFDNTHNRPKLIILDGILNNVYSKNVCDLFTKGSHRRNISVILITENLFHQGRFCRDISLNAKYLVVFKNARDEKHFTLSGQKGVLREQQQSVIEVPGRAPQNPRLSACRFRAGHG